MCQNLWAPERWQRQVGTSKQISQWLYEFGSLWNCTYILSCLVWKVNTWTLLIILEWAKDWVELLNLFCRYCSTFRESMNQGSLFVISRLNCNQFWFRFDLRKRDHVAWFKQVIKLKAIRHRGFWVYGHYPVNNSVCFKY